MTVDTQTAEAVQQQNLQEPDFHAPAETSSENGVELATNEVRNQFMKAMTPRNFDDVWRMSDMIAQSDLAPKDYRGKPGNVMIAWQTGVELGITSIAGYPEHRGHQWPPHHLGRHDARHLPSGTGLVRGRLQGVD